MFLLAFAPVLLVFTGIALGGFIGAYVLHASRAPHMPRWILRSYERGEYRGRLSPAAEANMQQELAQYRAKKNRV